MTDSSLLLWLKRCHEYSEELAVQIAIANAMIVMCELMLMIRFHINYDAVRQWVIVVVLERNVIRERYFPIGMNLRTRS